MALQEPPYILYNASYVPKGIVNGTTTVNATWTPPPWKDLNFTADGPRCDIATKYTAKFAHSVAALDAIPDVPPEYAINFTWSMLPDNARSGVTLPQLLAWYWTFDYWLQDDATVAVEMLQLPLVDCGKTICENLEWAGDSDITGVGMMISYYLVVLLVTLYCLILILARLPSLKNASKHHKWLRRSLASYTESVGTFLDSALVFAIAMLAAAITRYSSYKRNPDKSLSIYALFGSAFMSTFAVMPPIVLQCVSSGLRRHHVRQFMWFVVIGLTIAVDVLYREVYKSRSWSTRPDDWEWTGLRGNAQFAELIWLRVCDPRDTREDLEVLLTAGHVFLGINCGVWLIMWVSYIVFTVCLGKERQSGLRTRRANAGWWRWVRLFKRVMMTFNAVVALVLAWCLLGFFHGYRNEVSEVAKQTNADIVWTFGQVLALATWAPVLVDNTTIFLYGSTDGLSSKMPEEYKVVRKDGRTDSGAASMRSNEKSGESILPLAGGETPRPSGQHSEPYGGVSSHHHHEPYGGVQTQTPGPFGSVPSHHHHEPYGRVQAQANEPYGGVRSHH